MHPLLERQLRRVFGDSVPPAPGWDRLVALVDEAYASHEEDRRLLERALNLSSDELLESNANLQAIVHALPDLLMRFDADGVVREIHAGSDQDLYRPISELLGSSIRGIPDPEVRKSFQEAFSKVRRTRRVERFDYSMNLRDTEEHYEIRFREEHYEARLVPMPDGGSLSIVRNVTVRKNAIEASRQRSKDYFHLFNGARDPILVLDAEKQVILAANRQATETYGYDADAMIDLPFAKLVVDPEDLQRFLDEAESDQPEPVELLHRTRRGATLIIDALGSRVRYQDRDAILGIFRDVTQQNQDRTELANYVSLLTATLNSTADGILVVDHEGRVVTFNKLFCEMWSIPAETLTRNDADKAFEIAKSQLRHPELLVPEIRKILAKGDLEHRDHLEFTDGRIFERTSVPHRVHDRTVGRVWSFRDITDRKRAEDAIRHHAYHDSLTGLPNRLHFRDRLRQAMGVSDRSQRTLALLFIDLDRFKTINDSLGHAVGDRILQIVAKRLNHRRREQDTVARLGGDEFLVIASNLDEARSARTVANGIRDILDPPITIDGREFHVSASIGIALFPDHTRDPSNLMKYADVAMYRAKSLGGRTSVVFEPSMTKDSVEQLKLEEDVRRAVRQERFEVFYQPQVRLADGALSGAEALLRLRRDDGAYWPAHRVIDTAEQCGLIDEIGSWILRCTTERWAHWRELYGRPLRLAVNVSARQLGREDFKDEVLEVLERSGMDPEHLTLELTESAVMENPAQAIEDLAGLRSLGLQIAIDDFGTGHSSLSYLARLPMTTLKIDRSFVSGCHRDANKNAIVSTILSMGLHLKLRVVAEGIEERAEYDFLAERDCHEGQGYFIEHPLNEDAFERLVRDLAGRDGHPGVGRGDEPAENAV